MACRRMRGKAQETGCVSDRCRVRKFEMPVATGQSQNGTRSCPAALSGCSPLGFRSTPLREGRPPPAIILTVKNKMPCSREPACERSRPGHIASQGAIFLFTFQRARFRANLPGNAWGLEVRTGAAHQDCGQKIKGPSRSSVGLVPTCSIRLCPFAPRR